MRVFLHRANRDVNELMCSFEKSVRFAAFLWCLADGGCCLSFRCNKFCHIDRPTSHQRPGACVAHQAHQGAPLVCSPPFASTKQRETDSRSPGSMKTATWQDRDTLSASRTQRKPVTTRKIEQTTADPQHCVPEDSSLLSLASHFFVTKTTVFYHV